MKLKFKKLLVTVFSVSCLCIIIGLLFLFMTQRFFTYSPDICAESTEELQNPYIGWYQLHGYKLADDASYDYSEITSQEHHAGLVLLEFNLQNYMNTPLSDISLSLMDQLFQSWQSTGRQLIVRFSYDWDGNAAATEPQDLSVVLTHMTQAAEIVNRYPDCIYILQGIFVGSWGEMHGSRYTNNEDMITLINHLASVTDPGIFLAVRTPQQWRLLTDSTEPVTASNAFNGSLASRLSLFNDGMLGSDTDLDTYAADSTLEFYSRYEKSNRQEEISFQDLLCAYTPNGGEVVTPNPYNDFSAAVNEFSSTRVSYLNKDYDEAVFAKWRADTWTEDSLYQGMNGYDYISRHLGYRYVLRSSECDSVSLGEKTTDLTITLQNVGFSNCYRPFDVSLILHEPVTDRTFSLSVETDTRFWDPGEEVQLTFPVNIHEYATGTYDIYLKINDPASGSQIQLANDGERTENGHTLGKLDIGIFPGRKTAG